MYPTQQPERRDQQNPESWSTPEPTSTDNAYRNPVPGDTLGFDSPTETPYGAAVEDETALRSTDDVYAPPVMGGLDASRRFDPWNFRTDSGLPSAQDIIGYHVEATDGKIGKVDEVHGAANGSFLVVDTGPWIFGRKLMLPAGVVTHVDHVDRNVYVDRTKDEVKNSPEVDDDKFHDVAYLDKVEGYYGSYYGFPPGGTAR